MRIKCPHCNGKGVSELNSALSMVCGWCMGQGELDIEIVPKEPLTNEEWLHTLNTEEMVDYLYSVHKGGNSVERQKWIEKHKEQVKMQIRGWLKAKHDGSDN